MRRTTGYIVAALVAIIPSDPIAQAAPVFAVSGTGPTTAEFTIKTATSFQYSSAIITGTSRYAGLALYADLPAVLRTAPVW